jgi:DNA-binding NtrC family response regulator
MFLVMVSNLSKFEEISVLASGAHWAWPVALRSIFEPRQVNLLLAEDSRDFVSIIGSRRIHATIVDMDSEASNALATIRIIRMNYPRLPCILLANEAREDLISLALQLDVFSVIDKPVDMLLLLDQLNRVFMKRYDSDLFG